MQIPERIWLQLSSWGVPETWADHEVDGSDTEYVRADLCAELEAYPPRTGHWTGVEMQQARYLIAAMTGRTPEEVSEPLSELCHRLRYRPSETRRTLRPGIPPFYLVPETDGTEVAERTTGKTVFRGTLEECRAFINHANVDADDVPGMVVTDLEAWEYEGEDGG